MPRKKIDHRFLFDADFYEENKSISRLLVKLMYINANSLEYKKMHNVISEKEFANIIEKNPGLAEEYLKASFKRMNEPIIIESVSDSIVRNIQYAVYLGNQTPHRTIIFTSNKKCEEYLKSPHFSQIKNVLIRSGTQALQIIDEWYSAVTGK